MIKEEAIYTSGEAAKLLGVSIQTIKRWHKAGKINCFLVGPRKDRRFTETEIKRLRGEE